ncbi:hypothetical protein V6N12_062263 [Hibiscus sabdariffa]|uniref:Myb/SANT-like domain-containing protein n=1 Tax=Hibiscus sabdariffa TaxID=183260 RepID=A0ABR2F8F2_9ROSI
MWTKHEDAALIECLHILASDPHWKGDNGTFRSGYPSYIEKMLATKLPTAQIRANPHIESRVKLLKRQCNALSEMLNIGSGFGWNKEEKCLTSPKDVFDDWVRSHPTAAGLRNKSFPFFDDLAQIFGKERETGAAAETTADVVENLVVEDNIFLDAHNVEDEGVKDSESIEEIGASNCQASVAATTMKKYVSSKKRRRSDDGLFDLVDEMGKVSAASQKTAESIVAFFKTEAQGNDRRMSIFEEIMKIENLSKDDMLAAGDYISKEAHKVDFFFSLPKDFKKDYVLKQLLEHEHTNHLDMQSIDALPDALDEFTGGVVLVSHDSRLISLVCEDEEKSPIWAVDNGTVSTFPGTFEDYKDELQTEIGAEVDD